MHVVEFVFELFSFLLAPTGNGEKRGRSLAGFLRALLLVTGAGWFAFEFLLMLQLVRPFLFLTIALACSFTCVVLLLLALFFAGFIAAFKPKNFVLLVITLSLNLTATMSCLNRINGYPFMAPRGFVTPVTGYL